MQYATFRALGYPIGSGTVESANKLVVEARLKGAGMHWARGHVDGMVALRTIVCSDRWAEAWPQIATALRQQAHTQATQQRQARRARQRVAPPVLVVTTPTAPAVSPPPPGQDPTCVLRLPTGRHEEPGGPPPAAATTAPSSHRPAASHLWRRGYQARQRRATPATTVN